MKKTLLTIAAVALSSAAGWADQTTVNFQGDADLFGLTRYHSKTQADITFSQEVSFQQDGVSFNLKNTNPDGIGFALLDVPNGKPYEQGLAVYSTYASATATQPELSISSPGGKISGVKMIMGAQGLSASFEVKCEGTIMSSESTGAANTYIFTWTAADDVESINIEWENNYSIRYINSIEVLYTPDLGGKQASGLAFGAAEAQAIMGSAFTGPTLINPNKLPVSWSSSDKNVARVDADGTIDIMGPGKTVIKAETEGNDSFAAGNAQYTLTVIAAASNIAQLKEFAPSNGDMVYVKFPMTVTFANGSSAFVVDARDNATMIWNSKNDNSTTATATIYKEGDVIPAGWMATYSNQKGFTGQPADVTETDIVIFPDVTSVSYEQDADKVVILKKVTFAEATKTNAYFYGSTPDGTSYKFENTYNLPDQQAGTYDVKLVVRYAVNGTTTYAWLAPIAYMEPSEDVEDPEFPESFNVTTDPASLKVIQMPAVEDEWGTDPYTILVKGEIEQASATVTIGVPEGWDGFIYMDNSIAPFNDKKKAKAEWIPADELLEWGFQEGNVFEISADGMYHHYDVLLVKNGQADEANAISLDAIITRDMSGLDLSYPETFDVTLSVADLSVEQSQEVEGDYTEHLIIISGKTVAEEVTVTLGVPEGWDGFVGASDLDMEEGGGGATPLSLSTRSEAVWNLYPLAYLEDGDVPMKPVTGFTFPVDGEDHYGMLYLVKEDMFCDAPILLNVLIEKGPGAGISALEAADASARYFNLQGVEVKNPENGVFVKVANGKAVKVNL